MTQEEISKLARTTEEKESDGSFWDMKGGSIRGEQPPRHHPETEEEMAAEGNKTRCKQKGTTPSEAKDGFGKASFSETRSTRTSDTKKKAQVFSLRKAGNTPDLRTITGTSKHAGQMARSSVSVVLTNLIQAFLYRAFTQPRHSRMVSLQRAQDSRGR